MSQHTVGRHRARTKPTRRTTGRLAVAAAGLTAAFLAPVVGGSVAQAATSDDFARLRACESGGNYATNTGNGFYGAYQFDLRTWQGLGGSGRPSDASAATQDALAQRLQSQRGWSPWPACSARLGLSSGRGSAVVASRPASTRKAPASRSVSRSSVAYQGTLLTTKYVGEARSDVRTLQARLAAKGYKIAADGRFGPQTERAVTAFQRDAGIAVDGVVGRQTWGAAF